MKIKLLFLLLSTLGLSLSGCGKPSPKPEMVPSSSQNSPGAPASASKETSAPAVPAPSAPSNPGSGAKLSLKELEKLVAPIALYPDPLLAQILPASTYPLEIVEAARLIQSEKDVSQIDSQSWDPSVKAVAHYPSVIKMMNDKVSWTQQLGQAVLSQQQDVLTAIQDLRAQAQKTGNLKSTPQQTVQTSQAKIEILPPDPQIVYVPTYDPAVVYTTPAASVAAPLVSFGAGLAMGAWLGGGFYWPSNTIVWHSGYWGGAYYNNGYWNHGWNNVNVNVNNVNVNNWNHNNYNWNNSTWSHNNNYGTPYNHGTASDSRSMFNSASGTDTAQAQRQNVQNFQNSMNKTADKDPGAADRSANNLDSSKAARSNLGSSDRSGASPDRSNFDSDKSNFSGNRDSGASMRGDNNSMFGGGGDRWGGDRASEDSMRGFQSRGGGGFGGFGGFGGGGRGFGGGGGFHGGGGFRR